MFLFLIIGVFFFVMFCFRRRWLSCRVRFSVLKWFVGGWKSVIWIFCYWWICIRNRLIRRRLIMVVLVVGCRLERVWGRDVRMIRLNCRIIYYIRW